MEITISIGTISRATRAAKAASAAAEAVKTQRPSKAQRSKLKRQRKAGGQASVGDSVDGEVEVEVMDFDEEAMMNEAV